MSLKVHEHNLEKDRLFGNKTGREAKTLVWYLEEANDLHAKDLPLKPGPATTTPGRMKYPPMLTAEEPIGLKFMKYKLSIQDQEFVNAIDIGERMMAPVSPNAVASLDPDSPEAVAILAANFDRASLSDSDDEDGEAAVQMPSPIPPPEATESSPAGSEFNTITWFEENLAQIDDAFGNDTGTTTPSPNKKRKQRGNTPGSSTWNRRLGSNALPGPLRVTVQEPLGPGQINRASEIMAELRVNGSPKQLTTATGTAKAFQRRWNHRETQSLFNQQPSMGGYMPPGVALNLVRTASRRQVQHMAAAMAPNSTLLELAPYPEPTRLELGPYTSTLDHPTEVIKPLATTGRNKKLVVVPSIQEVSLELLQNYSFRDLGIVIDEYNRLPGMQRIGKPRLKQDRIDVVMKAKHGYLAQQL